MSKNKDFDNTVLAMSEWLDERMDAYLIILTKYGGSGLIKNGENEDIVEALADGMVDHPSLCQIILEAVALAMEQLGEINHCGEDINDFNLN